VVESADDLRDELGRLGERRAAARAELRQTSAVIPDLARRARDAGIPKAEIARLMEVSRPALDDMLAGRPSR
jgi:hypothetical protein